MGVTSVPGPWKVVGADLRSREKNARFSRFRQAAIRLQGNFSMGKFRDTQEDQGGKKGLLEHLHRAVCVPALHTAAVQVTNLRNRAACVHAHVLVHKGSRHAHVQTTRE